MGTAAAERLGFAARVREGAGGDGPAILLGHGLGGDASFWDEAFESPGLAPYSLVAVDLPGFGAAPPVRPSRSTRSSAGSPSW